jgi:hypothetical protein
MLSLSIAFFLLVFFFSSLGFASAQSVSVKLVEKVQYNGFDINNPSFSNGPSGYSPSGVPLFSSSPKLVVHIIYEDNVVYDRLVDLPNLPNDEFADFLVGEGVFANPRLSESVNVNERYEHIIGGFINDRIQWENNSFRYYFYEFNDEELAKNLLMDELSRRLEYDWGFP